MDAVGKLEPEDPIRAYVLEFVRKTIPNCPQEARGHSSQLAGVPPKPESEYVSSVIRNHGDVIDILNALGSLRPLLRETTS